MKKEKQITKGWKVFNEELKCRNVQFTVGKRKKQTGELILCQHGYHFHTDPSHLFNYYDFDIKNRVCEIIAYGKIVEGDDKSCCNDIELIKELTWSEVLDLINIGVANTGRNNSGDCNSGNRNSGDCNSGDRNSGDYNSGNYNSGDYNSGNYNSGDRNSGNYNSGDRNSGNYNSGDRNSGNCNSGDYNSGDRNSGNCNSGNYNNGNYNSGNYNSGDSNSGNCNSGIFNKTNYSNGIFNSKEQPISLFNGAAKVLMSKFRTTHAYEILTNSSFLLTKWISESSMTEQEKIDNPKFYVAEGYLKQNSYEHACQKWWDSLSSEEKKIIMKIKGFNKRVFFEVTGIKL